MLILPIKQIHPHSASNAYRASFKRTDDTVFEASSGQSNRKTHPASSTQNRQERRGSEALANANALHLGIAAQLLTSHSSHDEARTLPLPPATRTAARYSAMAEGLKAPLHMGFTRTL